MSYPPSTLRLALAAAVLASPIAPAQAAERGQPPTAPRPAVAPASDEAAQALRHFRLPTGWKVDLIAAEPDLANPVAFAFDGPTRLYVVETFRHGNGVLDIRGRAGWPSEGFRQARGLGRNDRSRLAEEILDAELAHRTVEDREATLRYYFAENIASLERASERLKRINLGPEGKAVGSTVFAEGFHSLLDGIASGVLARGPDVWFANIPHLWKLHDANLDGIAESRVSLHGPGYGVRVGFLGHDLHGLCFGPDGRLYFTIGDRGASVLTREGTRLETPDTGAVFRCEPDGSHLEIFATGLRNPQELVFDELGDLWTGDNNSDGGDQARWVHVVQGGNSGWHIGWQFLESPNRRGPWNDEHMWRPADAAQIAYLVPPLANIGAGPSGITYASGTGLPDSLRGQFFMVDFRGGPSGIWNIALRPKGASYEVAEAQQLLWNALPTDVDLGPDGGLYWSDWVEGWNTTGKGRIYRAYHPESAAQPIVADTRRWLGTDPDSLDPATLSRLLAHPDLRVRQRSQFALAHRNALDSLADALRAQERHPRLHALWGLGQIARRHPAVASRLTPLLSDGDPEIRAQSAKVLGDLRHAPAASALISLLGDPAPRPRFFAAIALGRLPSAEAGPALVAMLRANNDQDPFLRHAGVMGLLGSHSPQALMALATDPSRAVRLAAVVALRRLESPALAAFLQDADPTVVLETARAINDVPVPQAMPALAGLRPPADAPKALRRRILNANLRAGAPEHAAALAAFAADTAAPEDARAEALRHLAQFPRPSGRDQVTGLWRPLPVRDPEPAILALRKSLDALLQGPEILQVESARAVAALDVRAAAPRLHALARDATTGSRARTAALRVLGDWNERGFSDLIDALREDSDAAIRSEALRWSGRLGRQDALSSVRKALEGTSIPEKQAALASLAALQGESAAELLTTWLQRAADGKAPPELELELLESGRSVDAEPVRLALTRFEQSLDHTNAALARRYLLQGGDPVAGRKVFLEKQEVQCARCHQIGGEGGVVGPDLHDVGARLSRVQILESILTPNATVAAGYENVMIETRDGQEFSGTLQAESETELVLNTLDQGQVRVRKPDITFRKQGLSSMPEGLADLLSPRECRDLIEYLAGLTGTAHP